MSYPPQGRRAPTTTIIPALDNTYDLGSLARRWRDLYVASTGYFGRVGIGTTSPAENLHVVGNLLLGGITADPTATVGSLFYRSDLGLVKLFDGSANRILPKVVPVTGSVNVTTTETDLLNRNIPALYSGSIILPAISATWTLRLYLSGQTTPWDSISITTSTTSTLNDRTATLSPTLVDGTNVTSIRVTAVQNTTTAGTVAYSFESLDRYG